jgi:coronin-1B/1C/6
MHEHEVVRFFKSVNDSTIEPISFIVPRRAETFQDDIYPPAYAGEPSLTAEEWVSGKNSPPKVINLEAVFNGQKPTSTIAVPKPTPAPVAVSAPSTPKKTVEKKVVTPEPEKPKSNSLDDVLGTSNEVNSLLDKAKNAEDAAIPKALEKEESSWDAEPVPTKRPSPSPSEPVKPVEKKETLKPAAEYKKELPPKVAEVESKPVEEDDFEEITVVKKKSSPSATPISVSKGASPTSKSTSSSPVSSNNADATTVASLTKKLENLESKFEKLLSVVERLEGGQSKILDILNSK